MRIRSYAPVFAAVISLALPLSAFAAKRTHHVSAPKPTHHKASAPKPPHQNAPKPKPPHQNAPKPQNHASTPKPQPQKQAASSAPRHQAVAPQHHGVQHHWGNRSYGNHHRRYASHPNGSSLQQARLRHLEKLKADLDAISMGAAISPQQKNTLHNDLMTTADRTVRPARPTVQQLSGDLANVIARRGRPALDTREMTLVLEAAMNGGLIPASEVNRAIRTGKSVLQASGVGRADVEIIARDLKAVASGILNQAVTIK